MKLKKKKCVICREWFSPNRAQNRDLANRPSRIINIQVTCTKKSCKRERHRLGCLAWRKNHPEADKKRRDKIKAWAATRDYWRQYRQDNDEYRAQDNARRQKAHQRLRRAAKRDALRQIALGKLAGIEVLAAKTAAKRDALDPRVDGLLEFLFWKEGAAKRDALELASASR